MKKGRVSYPSFFMNYYNYIRMPQGSTKHKLAFKGATIMTNIARYTAADLPALMEKITRNSINMDEYFDRLFHLHETTSNYPPGSTVIYTSMDAL